MSVFVIDLVCIGIALLLGIRGYKKGAIGALIRLVGLIASFAISWYTAPFVTQKLMGIPWVKNLVMKLFTITGILGNEMITDVESFMEKIMIVLLFVVILIIFYLISEALLKVNAVKVVNLLDHILGMVLGIVSAVIILTVVAGLAYYGNKYTGSAFFASLLSESKILSYLSGFVL